MGRHLALSLCLLLAGAAQSVQAAPGDVNSGYRATVEVVVQGDDPFADRVVSAACDMAVDSPGGGPVVFSSTMFGAATLHAGEVYEVWCAVLDRSDRKLAELRHGPFSSGLASNSGEVLFYTTDSGPYTFYIRIHWAYPAGTVAESCEPVDEPLCGLGQPAGSDAPRAENREPCKPVPIFPTNPKGVAIKIRQGSTLPVSTQVSDPDGDDVRAVVQFVDAKGTPVGALVTFPYVASGDISRGDHTFDAATFPVATYSWFVRAEDDRFVSLTGPRVYGGRIQVCAPFPAPAETLRSHQMRSGVSSRTMSRTTVDIDPTVLRELKQRQRAEGKSLGQLISELVAAALASDRGTAPPPDFHWEAQPMRARVDLDDKAAVYAALDAG